jgi:Flp pilus assembly pilin Flp
MIRKRDQRGAVAVEAALLTPLLALVLFGIIEMSLFMRDVSSVSSATHVGARTASVSAGAGPGTCQASSNPPPCSPASVPALAQAAADAIQRGGTAMPQDQINWILVYQANPQGYPLPSGNTSANCSVNCVKYVWDAGLDKFRYASGTWTSSTINACINDPNRMAVGVIMNADHPWITGLFGSGVTVEERNVMQFEPLANDQCKPGFHQ